MGLTTHVLDGVRGAGAPGVRVDLARRDGDAYGPVRSAVTGADGRAVLQTDALDPGDYELRFHTVAYYESDPASPGAPFFDDVLVHFAVRDAGEHYHVPLVLAPCAYSTYRGGLPPAATPTGPAA
jgi:5-hydroxyisourate hydrolase